MSDMSDDESVLTHDPLLSEANLDLHTRSLRDELAEQYGDGVFQDDMSSIIPSWTGTDQNDDENGGGAHPLSPSNNPLSELESDDELPPTKNLLKRLIEDAEKVKNQNILVLENPEVI
jgi:hypothetical protein